MYKNFFNLLRDSIRGNILILLYPLPGSSLVPFHVTVLGSLFLTLLLTVCRLGSPYGVRYLAMPLTVEPSKPCLCNDHRFLNL